MSKVRRDVKRQRRMKTKTFTSVTQAVTAKVLETHNDFDASLFMHHLRACDLIECLLTCKQWRQRLLDQLPLWCDQLVCLKQGFVPRISSTDCKIANCHLQLLELYKRQLLDETPFFHYKVLLPMADPNVWFYFACPSYPSTCGCYRRNGSPYCAERDIDNSNHHWTTGKYIPVPSLGIKDDQTREPVWYHHLNSCSPQLQTKLLVYRTCMDSISFTSAVEHQISPEIIVEKWHLFDHSWFREWCWKRRYDNLAPDDEATIQWVDSLVDTNYLVTLYDMIRKEHPELPERCDNPCIEMFQFIFNPLQIQHYIPFFEAVIKRGDFRGINLACSPSFYPRSYRGGLTQNQLQSLLSLCARHWLNQDV